MTPYDEQAKKIVAKHFPQLTDAERDELLSRFNALLRVLDRLGGTPPPPDVDSEDVEE